MKKKKYSYVGKRFEAVATPAEPEPTAEKKTQKPKQEKQTRSYFSRNNDDLFSEDEENKNC